CRNMRGSSLWRRSRSETRDWIMAPELVEGLAQGAIPLLAGLYLTLVAYRVVGKKPGVSVEYDALHARHGKLLKIFSPLLFMVGAYFCVSGVIGALSKRDARANWQRYATPDGTCSAEFPAPPKRESQPVAGFRTEKLALSRQNGAVHYLLSFSEIPDGA